MLRSFLFIFLFILTGSCKKDFLKPKPTSGIPTEMYVTNLSTSEELLNGIYLKMAINLYKTQFSVYPELIADNVKTPYGVMSVHYSWQQFADEGAFLENNMNEYWMHGYSVIRDCNYLLENIDRFRSEDAVKADNIKGQAYAIRALVHHGLLNVFAQPYKFTANASHPGIPYVTVSDPSVAGNRLQVKEVYDDIVKDLQSAIDLIPEAGTNRAVINRSAAKAILARVYLFKSDYLNAKRLAGEIATNASLMKPPAYPAKLFSPEDTETLFWLAPAQTPYGTTEFQGFYYAYDYFIATSDIALSLRERATDVRNVWIDESAGVWQMRKFPQGVVPGISEPSKAYYQSIIRTSEIYLIAAESYAMIGNSDSSRYYLNAIRQRADATASTVVAEGAALLDSIYKERRKELCFEGFRMFDLQRLQKGVKRMDFDGPASSSLVYPSSNSIAPIPLTDVRVYSFSQNPGY